MTVKERFLEIYRAQIKRKGSEELLDWICESDFFSAPASSRFHLSREGGLCEHSLHVYQRLYDDLHDTVSGETIAICGLLHDLCKVHFYKPERKSRKTGRILPNGKPEWEDYMGYAIDDQFPYGHGEKSAYIITQFMTLTREEAMAIRWHMGGFDMGGNQTLSDAFGRYPLILHVHVADLLATYEDERE